MKIFFSIFTVSFLALAGVASAQMGMMGSYYGQGSGTDELAQSQELDNDLQEIYKNQNIANQGQIDCSKITDEQFEKIGDDYMGAMFTNSVQHEAMDNMMGGEGSESLRQSHINMGRAYLGCWGNYSSGPLHMSMMGGRYGVGYGMMEQGCDGRYLGSMMGGYFGGAYSWFVWATMALLWSFLVLGIAMSIKWLKK